VSRDDDAELRRRVLEWIDWEPGLRGSEIAVTSKDGTITLSGYVNSLAQKRMAERDSARVLGVRVIADDLRVRQLPEHERAHDMLHAVQHALDSDLGVPSGSVIAVVADDWVTLEGTVEREQQKVAAERRVAHVEGVRGITNGIQVRSMVASTPVPPERAAQERVAPTG
jgi:osmotically-inducible protein OsmY